MGDPFDYTFGNYSLIPTLLLESNDHAPLSS